MDNSVPFFLNFIFFVKANKITNGVAHNKKSIAVLLKMFFIVVIILIILPHLFKLLNIWYSFIPKISKNIGFKITSKITNIPWLCFKSIIISPK